MFLRAIVLFCSVLALSVPSLSQETKPAEAVPIEGIEHARLIHAMPLDGTLYHVQGVDLDSDHIWVTSVDTPNKKGYLHQFNRATGKFERQVEITDGPRYHPGGFSLDGNSIWVPVAEYTPHSTAVLEELDKHTLALKRKIMVADHVGCLAITPDSLIAGNWSSQQLYVFDRAGKQLRVIDRVDKSNQYQDIKFVDGMLVASGTFNRTSGAIDWFEWPSMTLLRHVRSGVIPNGKPYTSEAMTLKGNDLYLVPEDGPSRIFHFALETK